MVLNVKYKNEKCQDFEFVENKSDWIDLRANETVNLKAFQHHFLDLGFALKLPQGYEAHIVPRSSTFKNFGIIQTNSMGVIDNSYSGNEDYWKLPILAMRDTTINKGDRICQFRIMKQMENIEIKIVDKLDDKNRGGFGSTGKN